MAEQTRVFECNPLPPTERREPIRTAMRVLLDPNIPAEHAPGNHNCGECWECIKTTILLADLMKKESR